MYELEVTATQRVSAGRRPQTGQLRDAYDFVPGGVVRGAFAARWIREHGTPAAASAAEQAEFIEWFESGQIRFGPLYPADAEPRWVSVSRHKYGRPDGCEAAEPDAVGMDIEASNRCAGCGEPLQPGKGGIGVPGELLSDRTHVELDPDERPKEGRLFTRRSLRRRTALRGLVTGPDRLVARLIAEDGPLLLGGNRTASGRVGVRARPAGPLELPRLDGTRLTLRLYSPAIFVDRLGRACRQPDETQLAELLGIPDAGCQVTTSWVRTELVGGWHAASDLPKPVELAVAAGSVYLVECGRAPTVDGLRHLVDRGVGLRRQEGFGWVGYPAHEQADRDVDSAATSTSEEEAEVEV